MRETWDVSRDQQAPMLKIGSMPKQAEDGMRATLERIADLVERTSALVVALWRCGLLAGGLAPLAPVLGRRAAGRRLSAVALRCTCADPSSDGPV